MHHAEQLIALALPFIWLRPRLDARGRRVIAGEDVPASSLHITYIALRGAKLVLRPALGALLTSRWIA